MVPHHMRLAGMFCPVCGEKQPFANRCAFCKCNFPRFAVMKPDAVPRINQQPNGAVSSGTAKQGNSDGLLAPLQASLGRISKASLRSRTITLCVIVLLLISLVAGIVQYRSHVQKHYSQNYVLALYVMKSGMNLGEMVCNGTFNDWRGVEPSTVPKSAGIGPQALADLESVNVETDRIMGELGSPSAEYSQAAQILQKLYALYEKANSMIINSPGSLSRHKAEIDAAREEFSREIENLKAILPLPLAEELRKAGKKYDLGFMALEK